MTKKIIVSGLIAAASVAGPAAAKKPDDKDKGKGSPYACIPKKTGYNAKGTLVSQSLTQTAGADTAKRGDDRYSGELVVTVRKVNHKGLKGEQTYQVQNARLRVKPKGATPAAGDRVKVKGKVSKVSKKCSDPVAPTITVRKVEIKQK